MKIKMKLLTDLSTDHHDTEILRTLVCAVNSGSSIDHIAALVEVARDRIENKLSEAPGAHVKRTDNEDFAELPAKQLWRDEQGELVDYHALMGMNKLAKNRDEINRRVRDDYKRRLIEQGAFAMRTVDNISDQELADFHHRRFPSKQGIQVQ